MKKAIKWVGFFLITVVCMLSIGILSACNDKDTPATKEYTVTFYDGSAVLKTETVKEGEKATKWTPTKDDYEFVDWYATPNFGHLFNFEDPIKENKSAFAQWKSAKQSVDTREYYIVGSGTSPILMSSNWGKVFDETTKMTKATDKNEYTYTLDLQVGDVFQFAINESWHNQRGVGYLTTLKLADGTEAFSGANTIGDNSSYRLNIKCEYAGNYTFTLTTHPDDDTYETTNASYTEENKEAFNINTLDTISWVRNGDVSKPVEVIVDYYIKGSGITNWKDMYNAATKMTNDKGVYTLTVYLKENEEFIFSSLNTIGSTVGVGTEYLRGSNLDEASKAFVGYNESNYNMLAKASGSYTFTYTKATQVLSVTFDATATPVPTDYYIDGTFAEGVANWNGYCFNPNFKLAEVEAGSGIYEIKNVALKADSEIIIQAFKEGSTERGEWGTEGYNGLGSYNYTYLFNGGSSFSAVGGGNNNIKVLVAGNYDITFDSYAKMITMVKHIDSADNLDIYIKGENINSWNHGFSADYKFTISEDETQYEYVLTVEEGKAVNFGLAKYPKGENQGSGDFLDASVMGTSGDSNNKFAPENGNNFTCSTAGKYKVVYVISTGEINFYALPNA